MNKCVTCRQGIGFLKEKVQCLEQSCEGFFHPNCVSPCTQCSKRLCSTHLLNHQKQCTRVSGGFRKLNNEEAEFVADWFHFSDSQPDLDGYIGGCSLPKEVMDIYVKKYSKLREWEV